MKIIASIVLLFCLYCLIQIIARWQYRNTIEKTIWLVMIFIGIGWCISVFLS
jgi:hypothetical protein